MRKAWIIVCLLILAAVYLSSGLEKILLESNPLTLYGMAADRFPVASRLLAFLEIAIAVTLLFSRRLFNLPLILVAFLSSCFASLLAASWVMQVGVGPCGCGGFLSLFQSILPMWMQRTVGIGFNLAVAGFAAAVLVFPSKENEHA